MSVGERKVVSMSRRSFLALALSPALVPVRTSRRLAITMDDVNWAAVPAPFSPSVLPRILDALGKNKAALFVVGRLVDNDEGRKILATWSEAGHLIGNHTYDHAPLYRVGPDAFIEDIGRNEPLIQNYPTFRRWFRFPQLKEGDTRDVRDAVRRYLDRSGYRNGDVTIDASDWYYDQRLRQKLESDPGFSVDRYREPYLAHILDRARFYDGLGVEVLGRSVGHTLLLHYNLLNSLFLADLIERLGREGWEIIDAEEAYADPVHRKRIDVLPAGESLIWSLAHATGRYEGKLRYPGEDGEYEKEALDELGL
jgi:peptidoglycan-N-acetylglucosamine deacetylase